MHEYDVLDRRLMARYKLSGLLLPLAFLVLFTSCGPDLVSPGRPRLIVEQIFWNAISCSGLPGDTTYQFEVVVRMEGDLNERFSISHNAAWLEIIGRDSITPDTLILRPSAASLADSSYLDTILISVPGASSSPSAMVVQFSIGALIRTLPTGLRFNMSKGTGFDISQPVSVFDACSSSVAVTVIADSTLLTISPKSLTSPDDFSVTVHRDTIDKRIPGLYTRTITVASVGTVDSLVEVACSVSVDSWYGRALAGAGTTMSDVKILPGGQGLSTAFSGTTPSGAAGAIFRTTNLGENWDSLLFSAVALRSVELLDATNAWVAGEQGKVYRSTDGGLGWTEYSAGNFSIDDIDFVNAAMGWCVGDSGRIARTVDSGKNWAFLTSPTGNNLHAVQFLTVDRGYACGDAGTFLKTIDGGTTWTLLAITTTGLNDLHFVSLDSGFAVASGGTILRTTNGGISWTSTTISGAVIRGVHFANSKYGWAVADSSRFYATTNGGLLWSSQYLLLPDRLRAYALWATDTLRVTAAMGTGSHIVTEFGGR